MRYHMALVLGVGGFIISTSASAASYRIHTETVGDYTMCHGPPLDQGPFYSGQDFRNGIFSVPGTPFTQGYFWCDQSVLTSDFYDPQRTGAADYDQDCFDRPQNAIAWFSGHGSCAAVDTNVYCGASYPCATGSPPPPGGVDPPFCWRYPGDNYGSCTYATMARSILMSNCYAGPPGRNGRVNYSSGLVKWGESAYGGSWAGAGTNGGVNVVVLENSCGAMSCREQEVFPAFAGVHMIALTNVHTGDMGICKDPGYSRGGYFAARYVTNPSEPVALAWVESMFDTPHRNDFCTNRAKTESYGGGFGFNGCGGHEVISMDSTYQRLINHFDEDWNDIRSNNKDARGASYSGIIMGCNWDCITWPSYI